MQKKKKKPAKKSVQTPRWSKCVWCGQPINYNNHDWVVDGAGNDLHNQCHYERWESIKNERRQGD